jgi:periplasmic protein TonB
MPLDLAAAKGRRKELEMGAPSLQELETGHVRHGSFVLDLSAAPDHAPLARPAQPVEQYKKHSLVASNWGAMPASPRRLRYVAAEEAQETFLHGLLETPTAEDHRSPLDWVISLVIHVAVVAAVIIIPLAFTQSIDFHNLRVTYLSLPRPPAAAPAPRPPELATQKRMFHALQPSTITMPTMIPKKVVQFKDEAAPEIEVGGVAGGIEGGETGGVLGGILGGAVGPTPPPKPAAKKTVYRVGGDVKPPRELLKVPPVYSAIARMAHVEGTVEIDAIIDENGNMVQARAVSGPGLLIASALEAVMKWKYEPTHLDGTPVPIEMRVTVHFSLR